MRENFISSRKSAIFINENNLQDGGGVVRRCVWLHLVDTSRCRNNWLMWPACSFLRRRRMSFVRLYVSTTARISVVIFSKLWNWISVSSSSIIPPLVKHYDAAYYTINVRRHIDFLSRTVKLTHVESSKWQYAHPARSWTLVRCSNPQRGWIVRNLCR